MNQDAVGANLAAVVVGVSVLFIVALFVPMLFVSAFLGGLLKANRRGRRRW